MSFLGQKEEPLPLHILFSDFTKQLKQSVNFLITTFHDKSLFQAQHDTLLFQAECSQEVEVVPPVDTIVEKSKSMLNLPPPLSPPALPLSRFWPGRHQLSSLFLCILQLRFFLGVRARRRIESTMQSKFERMLNYTTSTNPKNPLRSFK